ncbi:AMP-binding protein [Patulibacter sp. NPDC049589]|uniref:AMP-binding protein n=1 Tax=Patulibacter sp. NPDC049589 TaxID=3154731 RepID=UPI00341C6A3D
MEFDVTTLHGRRADQRWNRMVVGDVLERSTWSHPDRDAIVGWEGAYGDPAFARVTYRQADEAANRVAHALLAAGLRRSDRVLLYCENSVEALLTLFGIAKAGLVAVPVNPLLAPDVLTWAIDHVGATTAIVDAELWPKAEAPFAAAGLSPVATITIGGDPVAGSPSFQEWIAGHPATEPDVEPRLHADDVWSVLFTSGTTAMPKASMATHTFSYLAAGSYVPSLTRGLRYEDELRLLTFLPVVYHCGHNSTVFPAFFAGGTSIIGRRPDPEQVAAAITAERATALWAGAPQFLHRIADAALAAPDRLDLTSLTVAMFSWGAMRPDLTEAVSAACGETELLEVFGQTESMSCFRFWPAREPDKHAESASGTNHVGLPNPLLGARIVDERGASLRGVAGVPGEAVYRSPVVTAGYFRDEAATREAFAGGWFHSGDSCAYLEDGGQVMVDRYKDIVKSGGENVSSLRVEAVVAQHPAVARAAVVGIPHDHWGEIVTAVVEVVPGRELDADGLIAFCRERLAGYETPKRVEVVEEMPQTVGGKVLKFKLRERFAAAPR